jgi:membrane protease YdiL (CAAX protease family)
MTLKDLNTPTGRRALLGYLAAWGVATAYLALRGADWVFPIISLGIFGIALSAIAFALTRRIPVPALAIARPRREALAIIGYVALYATVFVGWGLGAVKAALPAGPAHELVVLGYKLLIHVVLPAALIVALGGLVRPLLRGVVGGMRWWVALLVMCSILLGLLALVSPSLAQIAAFHLSLPAALAWFVASWLWISVEAGLCEEFLFRALLQSRLSAWLRSPVAAIAIAALLFALAHWPGLYLRGGPDVDGWSSDPLQVAAFTIATLSPIAVMMGVLWERTRSLLLVALVHGAIDALPNVASMIRTWH